LHWHLGRWWSGFGVFAWPTVWRCLFIELRETEIDQLIRRKLLAPDHRNDLGALRKALYDFFDDTLR